MSSSFSRRLFAASRQPIFPVIVFMALSLTLRENFPFSHFSMYSKPSGRPLRFAYLADSDGEPLAVQWHTGLSASRITKKFNWHKGEHAQDAKKAGYNPTDLAIEAKIKRAAGEEVLRFMRNQSLNRKGRELMNAIQLIEVTIAIETNRLVESAASVATIPGSDTPTP